MFWAYGELSNVEIICMKSFIRAGYELCLWTYGTVANCPEGVRIENAREIIPESDIFLNTKGSYAGFSDLFRYAVLFELGGLYVDTDVVAFMRADQLPSFPFFCTERRPFSKNVLLNGNIIFVPEPGNKVIKIALAYSKMFPKDEILWSEIGPDLLTAIVSTYPRHGFQIMGPDFANPIDPGDCPERLLSLDFKTTEKYCFVHLFNEQWRRKEIDKNAAFLPGSFMDLVSRDSDFISKAARIGYKVPPAYGISKACVHPAFKFRKKLKPIAEFLLTLGRVSRVKFLSYLGGWIWMNCIET